MIAATAAHPRRGDMQRAFDSSKAAIERRLVRLLYVCMFAAAGQGLARVVRENRHLMLALSGNADICARFPRMASVIADNDIFFEGLILALTPRFPGLREDLALHSVMAWPGRAHARQAIMWTEEWLQAIGSRCPPELRDGTALRACYRRVMHCCVWLLNIRIDDNRQIFKELVNYQLWPNGAAGDWMATIDLFFLAVYRALELDALYAAHPKFNHRFQEWPGAEPQAHRKRLLDHAEHRRTDDVARAYEYYKLKEGI